ncbi:hypothetical protein [Herbaspirillum sp. 1130]|uniref:hypothetical protein n=1 Tax=Herbaspirillum sp. 1130 TaxID=2806562 RepID=UPI001AE1E3A6|nr:hypothetical protein [Herbaspirillum sp. 1130]MBP1314275.1 hypothetical protein [Herbaspirillum sp. 1130]
MSDDQISQERIPVVRESRFFDTRINLQNLIWGLAGAAAMMTFAWFQLVGDVRELRADYRNKEAAQDERMTRIEQSAQQDRSENKERWGQVAAGLKEMNDKLDRQREMFVQNSPMGRQEMRRWVK